MSDWRSPVGSAECPFTDAQVRRTWSDVFAQKLVLLFSFFASSGAEAAAANTVQAEQNAENMERLSFYLAKKAQPKIKEKLQADLLESSTSARKLVDKKEKLTAKAKKMAQAKLDPAKVLWNFGAIFFLSLHVDTQLWSCNNKLTVYIMARLQTHECDILFTRLMIATKMMF